MNNIFTIQENDIPKILTNPYEIAFYVFLKRNGGCIDLSMEEISKRCEISKAKIRRIKKRLSEQRFELNGKSIISIHVNKDYNGRTYDTIILNEISFENVRPSQIDLKHNIYYQTETKIFTTEIFDYKNKLFKNPINNILKNKIMRFEPPSEIEMRSPKVPPFKIERVFLNMFQNCCKKPIHLKEDREHNINYQTETKIFTADFSVTKDENIGGESCASKAPPSEIEMRSPKVPPFKIERALEKWDPYSLLVVSNNKELLTSSESLSKKEGANEIVVVDFSSNQKNQTPSVEEKQKRDLLKPFNLDEGQIHTLLKLPLENYSGAIEASKFAKMRDVGAWLYNAIKNAWKPKKELPIENQVQIPDSVLSENKTYAKMIFEKIQSVLSSTNAIFNLGKDYVLLGSYREVYGDKQKATYPLSYRESGFKDQLINSLRKSFGNQWRESFARL